MEHTREGRVAVVTGGTGALGRWVVKALLEQGLTVHVPWVVEPEVIELRQLLGIPPGASAEALPAVPALRCTRADVTHPDDVGRFFAEVWKRERRLDALCCLVGGFAAGRVEETEPESWERMMRLNASSAFLACRAAVPLLRETGGGAIVTVASVPAVEGAGAGMSAYAASKAAVLGLTRALAQELRDDRIHVNAVAPEIIDTPANRAAMPDADTRLWLDPRTVAAVIAFLAGRDGSVVTGSVLTLKGS